jgi:hypothetical protein
MKFCFKFQKTATKMWGMETRRAMYVQHNTETIVAVEKQWVLNILSVSILALVIRCANCIFSMEHYIVACGLYHIIS